MSPALPSAPVVQCRPRSACLPELAQTITRARLAPKAMDLPERPRQGDPRDLPVRRCVGAGASLRPALCASRLRHGCPRTAPHSGPRCWSRRRAAAASTPFGSGQLDLNQRPFGPQPKSRAGRALTRPTRIEAQGFAGRSLYPATFAQASMLGAPKRRKAPPTVSTRRLRRSTSPVTPASESARGNRRYTRASCARAASLHPVFTSEHDS